jgi:hemoglobin-like flavoprotein
MALRFDLLDKSFAMLCDREPEFVAIFYEILFADYPEVVPMFANASMAEQSKKLFNALVMVLKTVRLPKNDLAVNTLRSMGSRHTLYGVQPEHYQMVGNSLIKAMSLALAQDWTDEMADAWLGAYTAITAIMLDGATAPLDLTMLKHKLPTSLSQIAVSSK